MKNKIFTVIIVSILCYSLFNVGAIFAQPSNPFPKNAGTVIFESEYDPIQKKVASPSIVILENGDYLVSHDFDRGTSVHISKDKGETWSLLSRVSPLIWANIFEHKGHVYLMGTSKGWGNIVVYRSDDQGKTWSDPKDKNTGILAEGLFHTAPVPIVKHNGKIWRAYEEAFYRDERRDFHALVICADEEADLLKASSWKRTNSIRFDEEWLNARRPNWFEGNIVVTPKGELINFMRLEAWSGQNVEYEIAGAAKGKPRNEIAAIIDIDEKNMKMEFKNEPRNFVHFPGAEAKFTIRYDSLSKHYWTITNKISSFKNTADTYNGNWHQRNVLVLMKSKYLQHWEISKKILRYNEGAQLRTWDTFGFQYVDWIFDGVDIAFVSRTSWYGYRYHDANMITFHRIEDFRNSNNDIDPEDLKIYTRHPKLIDIPVTKLSEPEFGIDNFNCNITVGKGLKQTSAGVFEIVNSKKVTRNAEQTLREGRYFDIRLHNDKMTFFSLETLDYIAVSNGSEVRLKWEYSIDGKEFLPITRYYIPVENKPGENTPEPTLFLQVYKKLNSIRGSLGVTLRCHVTNRANTPTYLKFDKSIKIGGREL